MNTITSNIFNLKKSMDILDVYIKNERKPFVNKNIPDVGLVSMFDDQDMASYQCENVDNKKLQKRIVELTDKAYKLGSHGATFIKATLLNYFNNCKNGFNEKEVSKLTEELITKYKDYSALCDFGFGNRLIDPDKLYNYYNEAIKKGYNVYEEVASFIEQGYGTTPNYKKALKVRERAYKKYKEEYINNKNAYLSATRYGYAAYNLAVVYDNENNDDKAYKYLSEAKTILTPIDFLVNMPMSLDEYLDRDNIQKDILQDIDDRLSKY